MRFTSQPELDQLIARVSAELGIGGWGEFQSIDGRCDIRNALFQSSTQLGNDIGINWVGCEIHHFRRIAQAIIQLGG